MIVIAIGTDHRGYDLKQELIKLTSLGGYSIAWDDQGAHSSDRSDYPEYAQKVCEHILNKQAYLGILLCGSGIGMSIAANRYKHIYAGLAWNEEIARLAREDDNCNVLVLPADFISLDEAKKIILAWLDAKFNNGKYAKRLAMLDKI